MLQFKIPFTKYYWGTALISVCGSSGSSFLNTMIAGIGLLKVRAIRNCTLLCILGKRGECVYLLPVAHVCAYMHVYVVYVKETS